MKGSKEGRKRLSCVKKKNFLPSSSRKQQQQQSSSDRGIEKRNTAAMAIDPEDLRIRFKSLIFESGSMATLQCELMYMEVSSKKISKLIISVPTNQGVVRVIEREVAGGEKRIVSIPLGSIMRNWSYIPREFELKVRLGNSGDDESGAPSTSSAMMFWQLPEEEEEGSELDFKTVIIQPGIGN